MAGESPLSRFVFATAAQLDFERIVNEMADANQASAVRWADKLARTCQLLAESPLLGHKRTDYTSHAVLFWTFGRYVLVYRVESSAIVFVAVLHGSRDVPAILHSRLQ